MGAQGKLIAVCISERSGTRKTPIAVGELRADYGIVGDSHAGTGRQVSLLADESIEKMRGEGLTLRPGDFAENLTISGLQLHALPVGARLTIGEKVLLEITQIGKECHSDCEIMRLAGRCVMPTEGVFAKVLVGGEVRAGDHVELAGDQRP
ncbi:MAG TPA: MOSC domain-containing protein [Armatimonadota bacterium]|nr:MOSC domain-containing protein [Armatimonadota bacterium]